MSTENAIPLPRDIAAEVNAGKEAWDFLRKTFTQWVAVGTALAALRRHAEDLGGRFTFKHLIEQQGFDGLDKATISHLEKLMARLPEVQAWRDRLKPKERFEWSSPRSVIRHCPVFKKDKPEKPDTRPPTRATGADLTSQTIKRIEADCAHLTRKERFAHYSEIATRVSDLLAGLDAEAKAEQKPKKIAKANESLKWEWREDRTEAQARAGKGLYRIAGEYAFGRGGDLGKPNSFHASLTIDADRDTDDEGKKKPAIMIPGNYVKLGSFRTAQKAVAACEQHATNEH